MKDVQSMSSDVTESEKNYLNIAEAWVKEQEAREKQIIATIETSSEIVRQNKIQLEWHRKMVSEFKKEHEEWKNSVGI